ncbi:MAG: alanine--tRNA ligase [Gemmatimonadota bacterium]|nr:MAG: alanine--tRNA ligase [Gemmatimonadota bacterium]
MNASTIRQSFIDFFKSRGHKHIQSASLVPADDPTLLFTNAGMVQFKQVFQGIDRRDYRRAVTAQKCVRAGGKHNDLEEVGHTARHHTFFEMLGNFSFGDYFKRDAIEFGWEWVTSDEYLGIDPGRIYVSVHHTDADARRLWREITGISDTRIYGLGDKDNFWQMGDTGPCGPCSEIYVDIRGLEQGTTLRSSQAPLHGDLPLDHFVELAESGHLMEIWNLVFMQFDQASDGSRTPLPAPSVDTGAGLERIAAVMQDVPSNFDTDLFMKIIERGVEVVGVPYDRGPKGVGYRVLADHARAVAFLIADEVYPSSEGRGYVLRRILRRAVRHAYLLGRREPTLVHMTDTVVGQMGSVYPELVSKADEIERWTRAEEERFLETIGDGLRRLDDIITRPAGTISGVDAFKLYDTFGFPIDLTELIARERGWSVDRSGFEVALDAQRVKSQPGHAHRAGAMDDGPRGIKGKFTRVMPRVRQKFVGYDTTISDTEVIAFRQSEDRLALVLRENPFYSESGGQVSDVGVVQGDGWELPVEDVRKEDGKQVVIGTFDGPFEPTGVRAIVDEPRRRDIERNHTATHLVHAALRNVLGRHVRQAGSVVAPDRLRFDFSHHAPVNEEELAAIEAEVNRSIWLNATVDTYDMPYADAIRAGAMALFGEKYGDRVRVVDIPEVSLELCGGTHVRSTGQIGLFHFTHETGVAAGVRRIEAVTGPAAYAFVKTLSERIDEVAGSLRTSPEHVARKIESLLAEKKRLEKQVEELLRSGSGDRGTQGETHVIGDVTLSIEESPVSDRAQIGLMVDNFRDRNKGAIKVLLTTGERPGLHIAVTDDLVSRGVSAGELARRLAAVSGGKGGGRPHFASAGIGDPSKLFETRTRAPEIVAAAMGVKDN